MFERALLLLAKQNADKPVTGAGLVQRLQMMELLARDLPGAPPTQRLRLLALPFSKHTVFGRSDVHELVTLLAEAPGTPCRLPKLRSMFAMRACRSAVMIGTALDAPKMRALVAQLADLVPTLKRAGATDVVVSRIDQIVP